MNLKSEFLVQKAKEIENFRRLPKYTHSPMGVINPPSLVKKPDPWRPDKSITFDGSTINLRKKENGKPEIPESLIRPPIDEEKLIRIKSMAKR
mmetsp:Transcript_8432/g.14121  ORF Transcript_8432/g.14121 Transcript_8432/m.14121 type:complete len:93 (-) Transcript_8432:2664-2942(-)